MANTFGTPTDNFETTGTNAVTVGASTIVLGTVSGLNANTYLLIDPLLSDKIESVYITSIDVPTKTVTVNRGESGTSAKAHDAGAIVIQAFMRDYLVDLEGTVNSYRATQLLTKAVLVTAGTAGNTASNAGTATTAARSDHTHKVFASTAAVRSSGSTGAQSITGVGFKPVFVVFDAVDNINVDSCSSGMATSSTQSCTYSWDSSGTILRSITDKTRLCILYDNTDSEITNVTFDNFTSDGFDVTWNAISTNVVYWFICFG
jgi:hypothetical protein